MGLCLEGWSSDGRNQVTGLCRHVCLGRDRVQQEMTHYFEQITSCLRINFLICILRTMLPFHNCEVSSIPPGISRHEYMADTVLHLCFFKAFYRPHPASLSLPTNYLLTHLFTFFILICKNLISPISSQKYYRGFIFRTKAKFHFLP